MSHSRFSREEFNTLFPGPFESEQQKQREYHAFLLVLEQLDRAPVPELPARERAEIFRRSWREPSRQRPSVRAWLAFLRRPAVTFTSGLVLGCTLMLGFVRYQADRPQPTLVKQQLTVERTPHMETYGGEVLQTLYPQIENPKLVIEKTPEATETRRVLHGTLDNGKIHVLWNL